MIQVNERSLLKHQILNKYHNSEVKPQLVVERSQLLVGRIEEEAVIYECKQHTLVHLYKQLTFPCAVYWLNWKNKGELNCERRRRVYIKARPQLLSSFTKEKYKEL